MRRSSGDSRLAGRSVLVTGGSGFIGSHLCERLLGEGARVWALDDFDPYYAPELKRANLAGALRRPEMHLVEGDLRDGVLLEGLLGDHRFDAVVHLAARPGIRRSFEEPAPCFDVNVRGTLTLLEALRRRGPHRLVFASSHAVYGETNPVPFREDAPADRPVSPYAATKRAGEMLCHLHHRAYGMSAFCLRLFTVYGPRQRPDLAIHRFTTLLERATPLPIYGDGASSRDYVFVGDVVRGTLLALERLLEEREPRYEVVNLGSGVAVPLLDLVSRLGEALNVTPRVNHLPERLGDVRHAHASLERAAALLGYRPEVELEDGLDRFVEWYVRSGAGTEDGPRKLISLPAGGRS